MDITPAVPEGRQIIERYGGGRFQVAGTIYESSVLVFPERTVAWPVDDIAALGLDVLMPIIAKADTIEILLLGCGTRMAMIPAEVKRALRDHRISVDAMDTGAACRTFNVLTMEERRVAAALIAVA
jgi:uncharacterized protein